MNYFLFILLKVLATEVMFASGYNLSCYQCIRYANEPCSNESLLPCPSNSDRCVTHVSKDERNGYSIKRECGLGPCGFEDDMVNKGLGMGGCDRSKDEYFCVWCCRTNGCNKNRGSSSLDPNYFLTLLVISLSHSFNHLRSISFIKKIPGTGFEVGSVPNKD